MLLAGWGALQEPQQHRATGSQRGSKKDDMDISTIEAGGWVPGGAWCLRIIISSTRVQAVGMNAGRHLIFSPACILCIPCLPAPTHPHTHCSRAKDEPHPGAVHRGGGTGHACSQKDDGGLGKPPALAAAAVLQGRQWW